MDTKGLPDFIIGGAMKSGTTSLHYYLRQHPQLFMLDGREQETHFFDDDNNFSKGTDWYRSLFLGALPDQLVGQTSPLYLYLDYVPRRIKAVLPNVKLIFILRNPIDRAYSHYWHVWRKRRENLSFERAVASEEGRLVNYYAVKNFSYVSRGLYDHQLRRYLECFDKESVKVILFEDLNNDPVAVARDCFDFLGVDPKFIPDTESNFNPSKVPKSRFVRRILKNPMLRGPLADYIDQKFNSRSSYPPMTSDMRHQLQLKFHSANESLAKLLNRDLSGWK